MNTYGMALLIALGLLVALYLFDKITGKNSLLYLVAGKPILSALILLAKALHTTTNNTWFDVLYITMSAAIDATERAEELWKNGDLPKEQREEYATLMVEGAFRDAGIEVTDDLQNVISGVISMACMLLPHATKLAPEKPKEVEVE